MVEIEWKLARNTIAQNTEELIAKYFVKSLDNNYKFIYNEYAESEINSDSKEKEMNTIETTSRDYSKIYDYFLTPLANGERAFNAGYGYCKMKFFSDKDQSEFNLGYNQACDKSYKDKLLGGYTEEELRSAFDAVADKEDWRNPIAALVTSDNLQITVYAINFYTANTTSVRRIPNKFKNLFLLESDGYRLGPAGDH
jgi:hypothetical protein